MKTPQSTKMKLVIKLGDGLYLGTLLAEKWSEGTVMIEGEAEYRVALDEVRFGHLDEFDAVAWEE